MDRQQEKDKARKRWEETRKVKARWRESLKQEHGYNERSWDYAFHGEKMWEWFEGNAQRFNTRCCCSCPMCGNPRKHFAKKLTRQELKLLDKMKDEIDA